jgi:MoxR-like ATPase
MAVDIQKIKDQVLQYSDQIERVKTEVRKALIGQDVMLSRLLIALLTGGHVLLEGVPGLAKTTAIKALAAAIHCKFNRIQFTPDLLPADLIGTLIYNPREGAFSTRKGPIFANLVLADEINRAPSKVQSALLEAMQEHQVTIGDESYILEEPFLVLATQNPIDYEGTYPLPEAQLDRFVAKLEVGYPDEPQERAMLSLGRRGLRPTGLAAVRAIAGPDDLLRARSALDAVIVSDAVRDYVVALVRRTRDLPSVSLGASPRAAVHLLAMARAGAALAGRGFVIPDDVAGLAGVVLRHRIVMSPEAELEQYTSDDAIRTALAEVPVPR